MENNLEIKRESTHKTCSVNNLYNWFYSKEAKWKIQRLHWLSEWWWWWCCLATANDRYKINVLLSKCNCVHAFDSACVLIHTYVLLSAWWKQHFTYKIHDYASSHYTSLIRFFMHDVVVKCLHGIHASVIIILGSKISINVW